MEGCCALDINGFRTGVCVGDDSGGPPRFLSWALNGCADEEKLTQSCGGLYGSVAALLAAQRCKFVAIEEPLNLPGRNPRTTPILMQLTGAARAAGVNAGAIVILGKVTRIRVHFIGAGNLKSKPAKQAVFDRCKLLGWSPVNTDESDAGAIFSWAMATKFPRWSPRSTPLFGGRHANA
jgi:Holliday junction resolvasome RuvABC endonuclease subunit